MAQVNPHIAFQRYLSLGIGAVAASCLLTTASAQQRGSTLDMLLPPSFQASGAAPPATNLGDSPPNLRPPEFSVQPLPPTTPTPAPAPAPVVPAPAPVVPEPAPVPVVPAPAPARVPAPAVSPTEEVVPMVPVDPQAGSPVAPPPITATKATEVEDTYRPPQPHTPTPVDTAESTAVPTQTYDYNALQPTGVRPMGRRSTGAGRVIGQRYEVPQSLTQSRVDDPLRPVPENSGPVTQGGYFPTSAESPILAGGNADYPRVKGDRGYWNYSGLWPVRPAPDNFYQRNGAFYDRVDNGLRTFIPGQNVLFHSPDPDFLSVDLNYDFGIFSEDIAEDRVMLKLGPLYLDFLGFSAALLYTDYSGDSPLANNVDEEGWIGILGIPVRAALRITDTIYIQSSAFFYFLPGDGEFGVSSGIGSGWALGTNVRMNIEWENDEWMFRLYDYFGFRNSLADFFEEWDVAEVDAVGRYRFGSEALDGSHDRDSYWDPRFGGYRNDIGFEFQRPFENEWWLLGSVIHSDYWPESDFDNHRYLDQFNLVYRYMGDDWMFAPSFGYRGTTPNGFDTMTHEVYARVTGRITEYLSAYGQVGYLWQNGQDSTEDGTVTWELGINHDLTQYTRHSLSGGQVYALDEDLDEYVGEYVRYTISHAVSERLKMSAYGQYQDSRRLGDGAQTRGWTLGASGTYRTEDDLGLTAGVTYQNNDLAPPGSAEEIWIYYARVQRPLFARLNANVTYQYLDQRGPKGTNIEEHLLIMGVNYLY